MKKRLLILLMAFTLLFSVMVVPAFAASGYNSEDELAELISSRGGELLFYQNFNYGVMDEQDLTQNAKYNYGTFLANCSYANNVIFEEPIDFQFVIFDYPAYNIPSLVYRFDNSFYNSFSVHFDIRSLSKTFSDSCHLLTVMNRFETGENIEFHLLDIDDNGNLYANEYVSSLNSDGTYSYSVEKIFIDFVYQGSSDMSSVSVSFDRIKNRYYVYFNDVNKTPDGIRLVSDYHFNLVGGRGYPLSEFKILYEFNGNVGYALDNFAVASGVGVFCSTPSSESIQDAYNAGFNAGYAEGFAAGAPKDYYDGYNNGHEEGYQQGYTNGENNGYGIGYIGGQTDGYNSGHSEGYSEGKADGYQEGHAAGLIESGKTAEENYNSGYAAGFAKGTVKGQNDAKALEKGVSGFFDGLSGFFTPFLNLGFGSITIASLLGVVVIVFLVSLIFKLLKG